MIGYSVKIPLVRDFILYTYNDFEELTVDCKVRKEAILSVYGYNVLTDLEHNGELIIFNWLNTHITMPLQFIYELTYKIIAQNIFAVLSNNDFQYKCYNSEEEIIADLVCLDGDYNISIDPDLVSEELIEKARRRKKSLMNLEFSAGKQN